MRRESKRKTENANLRMRFPLTHSVKVSFQLKRHIHTSTVTARSRFRLLAGAPCSPTHFNPSVNNCVFCPGFLFPAA